MSILFTLIIVVCWVIIPTAMEALQTFAVWSAWITAPFVLWMLYIKLDRVINPVKNENLL